MRFTFASVGGCIGRTRICGGKFPFDTVVSLEEDFGVVVTGRTFSGIKDVCGTKERGVGPKKFR
jgi:hypothetical protein